MKLFFASFMVLIASFSTYAHDKENTLADQKKEALQMVDEHAAALAIEKTCLTAATDKDGIEKCEEAFWKTKKHCSAKCKKKCHHEEKKEE